MKYFLLLTTLILFYSCNKNKKKTSEYNMMVVIDWKKTNDYYLKHISKAIVLIDSIEQNGTTNKNLFIALRNAFKKAEPYASYLNPEIGHRANGPALPIFKEDNGKVMNPIGLQKIEESIYEGGTPKNEFINEVSITKGLLLNLKNNIEKHALNPQRFFIATHQQLLRIISHSITGFDTPVSGLGINEAAISLQSLVDVYQLSLHELIKSKNEVLDKTFIESTKKAISFLKSNTDFDSFDRYTFIRNYFNDITRYWVMIRKESGLWNGVDYLPFNFDAPTFFETNSFNKKHFATAGNKKPSKEQIVLGEKLFFDTNLSKNKNMSCATCHDANKGFGDGRKVALDNEGGNQERNAPTLLNVAFQKAYFWDGRSSSLFDQISSVFLNKKEFNSSVHEFSSEILKDSTYKKLFTDAFGSIPKTNTEVIKALTAYTATLNGFNSKFDKNMRGDENSFTNEEKIGANLFMGKALCATCHFLPLTNGTVPPFFEETEKEVIGVPKKSDNKELDTDNGFYWVYKNELHKGMFKTPTVRNAELTAPYMHNGVYNTLEEVIDFYNKGGGAGLGFDLPHQTLPFDNLELTDEEQNALIAFVKTLTDSNVNKKLTD